MTEEEYNANARANTEKAAAEGKIIDVAPYDATMFGTATVANPTATPSQALGVTPNDYAAVYEVLAPMAGDYLNAQAEQIGQAQKSMGTLAGRTMGSTTSGLGNYTYNRLMRPQIDTMRDELLVKGYATQLNRLLSDALNNARRNYNKKSSGGDDDDDDPDNKGTTGVTKITGSGDKSTGSGKTTTWTNLPNSYQWQDDDGNWHTATRSKVFTDEDWLKVYQYAKNKYSAQGRFKG